MTKQFVQDLIPALEFMYWSGFAFGLAIGLFLAIFVYLFVSDRNS